MNHRVRILVSIHPSFYASTAAMQTKPTSACSKAPNFKSQRSRSFPMKTARLTHPNYSLHSHARPHNPKTIEPEKRVVSYQAKISDEPKRP